MSSFRRHLVIAGLLLGLALSANAGQPEPSKATFSGGCFWCMQPAFDGVDGVVSTTVGYTGGEKRNPTYEEVSSGGTGHLESIEVTYDPGKVSYEKLLDVFWHNVDPLDPAGQFCDKGEQYRAAIFFHDDSQRRAAEESKRKLDESGRLGGKIVTAIRLASTFWSAEEYHQKYYRKNPIRYRLYRFNCGREKRLTTIWGSPAGH